MSQFNGISGHSAQDAVLSIVHDVKATWNHNRTPTLLTFDITGYFNFIPHHYLIDTLRRFHILLQTTKWVYSFVKDREASICLNGKKDSLKPFRSGIPQGSCMSLILVAYFTAPMGDEVNINMIMKLAHIPEPSTTIETGRAHINLLTLYVDDSSIVASVPNQETGSKLVKIAFSMTHEWLATCGLKVDQVKSELIHFTKSNQGKNAGQGPPVTIPTNSLGISKMIEPSKMVKYLGVWLDSCHNFIEHVQKSTTKAIMAAHSLRLLGNSI